MSVPAEELPAAPYEAPAGSMRVLHPGQLTDGWRWIFTAGWALIIPALIAIADAAHTIGKPPWWLDSSAEVAWWTVLILVPPVVPVVAGAVNWRGWPLAAAFGVVALTVSSLVNYGRSPGIAVAEAAMALAGLATSAAAFAGRVRASTASGSTAALAN
jgi:hypothetical protein